MKKVVAVVLMLALMSMMVMAKPVTKSTYTEYWDIDGDGVPDEIVVVEESLKQTKKSTTVSRSFFTEDYREYLGMELLVNGDVIVDTFVFNN